MQEVLAFCSLMYLFLPSNYCLVKVFWSDFNGSCNNIILFNPPYIYEDLGDSCTLYQSFVTSSVINIFAWRITKSHQKIDLVSHTELSLNSSFWCFFFMFSLSSVMYFCQDSKLAENCQLSECCYFYLPIALHVKVGLYV